MILKIWQMISLCSLLATAYPDPSGEAGCTLWCKQKTKGKI